jgi:tetratricopeptide (TPR) repeat protein
MRGIFLAIARLAFAACAGALLFAAAPVRADMVDQQAAACVKAAESADSRIMMCSLAIMSGRWSGRSLAALYYARGQAYLAQQNRDSAIKDFDEALRLHPDFAEAKRARQALAGSAGTAQPAPGGANANTMNAGLDNFDNCYVLAKADERCRKLNWLEQLWLRDQWRALFSKSRYSKLDTASQRAHLANLNGAAAALDCNGAGMNALRQQALIEVASRIWSIGLTRELSQRPFNLPPLEPFERDLIRDYTRTLEATAGSQWSQLKAAITKVAEARIARDTARFSTNKPGGYAVTLTEHNTVLDRMQFTRFVVSKAGMQPREILTGEGTATVLEDSRASTGIPVMTEPRRVRVPTGAATAANAAAFVLLNNDDGSLGLVLHGPDEARLAKEPLLRVLTNGTAWTRDEGCENMICFKLTREAFLAATAGPNQAFTAIDIAATPSGVRGVASILFPRPRESYDRAAQLVRR